MNKCSPSVQDHGDDALRRCTYCSPSQSSPAEHDAAYLLMGPLVATGRMKSEQALPGLDGTETRPVGTSRHFGTITPKSHKSWLSLLHHGNGDVSPLLRYHSSIVSDLQCISKDQQEAGKAKSSFDGACRSTAT